MAEELQLDPIKIQVNHRSSSIVENNVGNRSFSSGQIGWKLSCITDLQVQDLSQEPSFPQVALTDYTPRTPVWEAYCCYYFLAILLCHAQILFHPSEIEARRSIKTSTVVRRCGDYNAP